MSDRAAVSCDCSRWRWVATGGGVAVAVFFIFLLCFSLLLLPLAFRLFYCSDLVSFLSLLWCWRRRGRWWCWVLSAGFLLPWPSLRLFSCYRFLVMLPLVLVDGVVKRWSWWWYFFSSYFSLLGGRSPAGFFLLGLVPVWFSRLYSLLLPLFLLFLVRSSSVFLCFPFPSLLSLLYTPL
jgi:hypothetical protein